MMQSFFSKIPDAFRDSRASALCIVTSVSGSAPGKAGAKMIVFSDGSIEGTVGGGSVEKTVIELAQEVIRTGQPLHKDFNLQKDLAMTCGGALSVYIEPLLKPARLYIFGAGHIGKALAEFTPAFGFETFLIDWRKEIFVNPAEAPYRQLCKPYLEAVNEIVFDGNTYIVIVTPNHEMDEEVLAAVGKQPSAYVGLIGSRRKIETLTKKFLDEKILSEDQLKRVDMPIGIKFNAITPAEIAISILARLIDVKNSIKA